MSIYHQSQPAAIEKFRENTDKRASMAGVQYQHFTCRCCRKSKPLDGRKRLTKHHKDGYKCAECAGSRS